jgi:hypothetical protein
MIGARGDATGGHVEGRVTEGPFAYRRAIGVP